MFGYVKADIPELKVREKEYYRAIYCGLCRAQGKCTGQCSRLTLSYDMAFLAMVRMAVLGIQPEIKQGRCIMHPIESSSYAKMNSELEYCARVQSLLTYGKLRDDIADERGARRFRARIAMPFVAHSRRRVVKNKGRRRFYGELKYEEIDRIIIEKLDELSKIEQGDSRSVDEPAEIFGELLSEVAAYGTQGNNKRVLKNIGFNLGKWVYMVDAADDCEDDKKRGRYNPFLRMYDGEVPSVEQRGVIADVLKVQLCAVEPAFDLIEYNGNRDIEGIVNNILYIGMPKSASDALRLTPENKKKK